MLCLLRRYGLFLILLVCHPQLVTAAIPTVSVRCSEGALDEEYDAYRRKGDLFFKAGRYNEARQQYQNCLEVPGFEKDSYASERIDLSTKCLSLLQQADEALQSQNDTLLVTTLKEVLRLNPADGELLNRLADHYELGGNKLFAADNLSAAKTYYEQALVFVRQTANRARQSTLETQLKAIDGRLERLDSEREAILRDTPGRTAGPVETTRRRVNLTIPILKVGLGGVAVGAGVYAYVLRHTYTLREAEEIELGKQLDPRNEGVYNPSDNLLVKAYQEAVTRTRAAHRQGLYQACLGVAAAAALAEAYLFLHKPKARISGFFWQPAATMPGLQIGYRF